MFSVIVHRCDLVEFNPRLIKPLCHPSRIGIDNLSDEQFIANGND